MQQMLEDTELFIVIILTLIAKWLMSEEPIPEDETPQTKRLRRKRAYGGVIAGAMTAYYGPGLLILWSNSSDSLVYGLFSSDLIIPLTIIMTLSGEHIFRALITKVPTWIELFVNWRLKS